MKVKFQNLSEPVKSSTDVKMYREGNNRDATIKIKTYSNKRELDVKNSTASMVSGMRGNTYPYVLSQSVEKVKLIVNSSTNQVTISYDENGRKTSLRDGMADIDTKATARIGLFEFEVMPKLYR